MAAETETHMKQLKPSPYITQYKEPLLFRGRSENTLEVDLGDKVNGPVSSCPSMGEKEQWNLDSVRVSLIGSLS